MPGAPDKPKPQPPAETTPDPRRLRPGGGYRKLRSFRTATLIYDGTVSFCQRFVDPRSLTHDQMVQAARTGRQNIAEGNRAGATGSASEIRLTNVARASLDELLLDYEDFLRQRQLPQWEKDSPEAVKVRRLGRIKTNPTDRTDPTDYAKYAPWLEHPDPAVAANTLICFIHQTNYLLDCRIAALERAIIEKGGYRENLLAARLVERARSKRPSDRSDPTDPSDPTDRKATPTCPECGQPMRLRTARQGKNASTRFWGCSDYPNCKGTRPMETAGKQKKPSMPPDRSNPTDPRSRKSGGKTK